MSVFTAIRGASDTLKELLKRYITDTTVPELGADIHLEPPNDVHVEGESSAVSLWLYQVERNPELLNQPRVRSAPNRLKHQPFPVNLRYLVTPMSTDVGVVHATLGRIVQVFHEHSIVDRPFLVAPLDTPIRICFQPLTLEELTRVWDALKEPYQLSIAYMVQLVNIDALRPAELVVPVTHARANVGVAEAL